MAQTLERQGEKEAIHLSNRVATLTIPMIGVICIFGWIYAPQVVYTLAPGFFALPGKAELTNQLTRVMIPFLLIIALSAQAMGILNARNIFAIRSITGLIFEVLSNRLAVIKEPNFQMFSQGAQPARQTFRLLMTPRTGHNIQPESSRNRLTLI